MRWESNGNATGWVVASGFVQRCIAWRAETVANSCTVVTAFVSAIGVHVSSGPLLWKRDGDKNKKCTTHKPSRMLLYNCVLNLGRSSPVNINQKYCYICVCCCNDPPNSRSARPSSIPAPPMLRLYPGAPARPTLKEGALRSTLWKVERPAAFISS
jgi:hypothetical protein